MTELEKIIRPIVEGQIRGFMREHPAVVDAVDWYKPGRPGVSHDKARIFLGSLSKRIVRDLTCGSSSARLAAALLRELRAEAQSYSTVEYGACGEGGRLGRATEPSVSLSAVLP